MRLDYVHQEMLDELVPGLISFTGFVSDKLTPPSHGQRSENKWFVLRTKDVINLGVKSFQHLAGKPNRWLKKKTPPVDIKFLLLWHRRFRHHQCGAQNPGAVPP